MIFIGAFGIGREATALRAQHLFLPLEKTMKIKKFSAALVATFFFVSGAAALETDVAPEVTSLANPAPKTGLFVGNSFTYYNCGVNDYVRGLTKAGRQKWTARMITISGGALAFHPVEFYVSPHERDPYFKNGNTRPFDVVFLQGQSARPISENHLPVYRKYLKAHIEAVRKAGGEPVVVGTWARQDSPEQTRTIADLVIAEANKNHALVLPVGLAFAESLKERPELILHHSDKRHPSAAGSYLYGAMVYSLLFKKSPEGLDFLGDCAKPLSKKDARFLQRIAWRVTKEFYGWD